MTEVRFVAIDPSFEVVVRDEPLPTSAARAREVERLWDTELESTSLRAGDSPVLTYVRSDRRRLTARWVSYREFAAGRREPRLYDWAPPVPVGISGRVTSGGRVVLGRRAAGQGVWSGHWEMAPCNDLDRAWSVAGSGRIDVGLGLRAALAATTPLAALPASPAQPFALGYDELEPAWRVCVAQELAYDAAAFERLESSTSERYDAFRLARPAEIVEAGLLGGSDLVPMTAALARLPGSLQRVAG